MSYDGLCKFCLCWDYKAVVQYFLILIFYLIKLSVTFTKHDQEILVDYSVQEPNKIETVSIYGTNQNQMSLFVPTLGRYYVIQVNPNGKFILSNTWCAGLDGYTYQFDLKNLLEADIAKFRQLANSKGTMHMTEEDQHEVDKSTPKTFNIYSADQGKVVELNIMSKRLKRDPIIYDGMFLAFYETPQPTQPTTPQA